MHSLLADGITCGPDSVKCCFGASHAVMFPGYMSKGGGNADELYTCSLPNFLRTKETNFGISVCR